MKKMGEDSSRKILENYVNDLIQKGYKKKDIKEKLLKRGYDNILVNKLIYPYLSVLVISGIILVLMILVVGAVVVFMIFLENVDSGNGDSGNAIGDSISEGVDWSDVGRCWENGVEVTCENLDELEEEYNACESLSGITRDECILELASTGYFKLCKEIVDEELYNECYVRAFEQRGVTE